MPARGEAPGGNAGQATVEFALLIPFLVLVALTIAQVGLVVRDQVAVTHAAREAARTAAVDTDPHAVTAAARRVVPGADVEIGPRPGVGEPVRVEVRYRSPTRLPLVGPFLPDPVLSATAVMRVER